MARLYGWDYTTPFFYMVTIMRLPGLRTLAYPSTRYEVGHLPNRLTSALEKAIADTLAATPEVESLSPYAIMTDHLHFLIKLRDGNIRVSLIVFVQTLIRALTEAYNRYTGHEGEVFASDWNDLIVKKDHQLERFRLYIRRNPWNYELRRLHPGEFCRIRNHTHERFGPQPFTIIGEPDILDEPAMLSLRGGKDWKPGDPDWERLMRFCRKWRPGLTAVGTWVSKAEKAAREEILKRGGRIIMLCTDGIADRWHPKDHFAPYCASGRFLYLSVYPPQARQLTRKEFALRCEEMNALAARIAPPVFERKDRRHRTITEQAATLLQQ